MNPGTDCDLTLAHPDVSAGTAMGFLLKAERGRKSLEAARHRRGSARRLASGGTAFADFGPGPREWKLAVRIEPLAVAPSGAAASTGTLDQLRQLYAAGGTLTLALPGGESYSVIFLSLEERSHPPDAGTTAVLSLVEVPA